MAIDVKQIGRAVEDHSRFLRTLTFSIEGVIVGQQYMIERLLVGLLAGGHVLLEGVPGLAKTLTVTTLSKAIQAQFQRIQFTPDLLPADLIGTLIYNPRDGSFAPKKGPIFAHIVLADEINRAPPKVQSALLEAMQEKQVTIGDESYVLDEPFLVLATQNPIEQEGTYPLPEAQVDRFMLKLKVTYPSKQEERRILDRMGSTQPKTDVEPVVSPQDILQARTVVDEIYVDDKVKDYIVDIVQATRTPGEYELDLAHLIEYGASPRATIALTLGAKAYAFLQGRGYVTPQDVKSIGPDVLRHRLIPSYEAEAEERSSASIAQEDPAAAQTLYDESIVRFEEIIQEGDIQNGKLFYNLANAYLLRGDVGRAILNYRRAERLTPEDRNLQGNLGFARTQVRNSIPVKPQQRILETLFFWHYDFSTAVRLAVFAVAFDLIWILAVLKLLNPARVSLRLPVATLAVITALFLVSLIADEAASRSVRDGVLVADQTIGRKGPDLVGYEPSFSQPLYAGVEFDIVEERSGWHLVRLRDGRETWLPASAIEQV